MKSLQKVELDFTFGNDPYNLSRNDFSHCLGCYTLQWLVQLVSQRFYPLLGVLHAAMARATRLATILSITWGVTRCNGSCNSSHNDFIHCLGCYTLQWLVQLVSQRFYPLLGVLHAAMARATRLATILSITWGVTRCNGSCNSSRNDFIHCLGCYTLQWLVQLVSQRFYPLLGVFHVAMARATRLAIALRHKLLKKLLRVTLRGYQNIVTRVTVFWFFRLSVESAHRMIGWTYTTYMFLVLSMAESNVLFFLSTVSSLKRNSERQFKIKTYKFTPFGQSFSRLLEQELSE